MPSKINSKVKKLEQAKNGIGPGINWANLGAGFGVQGSPTVPMSQPYTLANSNNYVPLTLDRILLTFSYMTHGIFQTAIDQPVYDAFRGGLVINCPELDEDEDIPLLQRYIVENKTMHELIDAWRWARLYGGSGLIINTAQDSKTPLRRDWMDYPDLPLNFVAADRWELTMSIVNFSATSKVAFPYNYYGTPLDASRVMRIIGKEAPAFIRPQLMGWGFSELERMIRDLNAYVKANQAIFQLLDEAKIDVWRLMGFNDTILSDLAGGKVNSRLQCANMLKNYHNAIMMDKDDEFEQRTQTFAGFADILYQIRLGICSSLRMPMSKVFGQSAQGLQANQDDLESYNALIESEIREPAIPICQEVLRLSCRQLFGFEPEELTVSFHPLRVLSAVEEEEVKTSKQNRLFQFYTPGLLTPQETMQWAKKQDLMEMDSAVLKGADPEPPMVEFADPEEDGDPVGGGKKKAKAKD